MPNILLVDDDAGFTDATSALLSAEGLNVCTASTIAEARSLLESGTFDIQFVDLALPDGSGLELVDKRSPRTVIITGHPSVETAIRAVRDRVDDYLVKPLNKADLLSAILTPAQAKATTEGSGRFAGMVGESPQMQALYSELERYGPTNVTVLIRGESGTGKDLVARALHEIYAPKEKFIAVNCGAIPAELIASELFGHEKGSFTGATGKHLGFFERAGNGTVFLDEIGELPLEQQVTLLRVLENRTVQRVGGDRDVKINARVVAATNADIEKAIAAKEFREDLYYRLMVLPVDVPPLREREGDVELLAKHFLAQAADEHGAPGEFADAVLDALQRHSWPGNVRELKHTVLRSALMCIGNNKVDQLPVGFERPPALSGDGGLTVGMSIREVERELIMKTLDHYDGNKTQTAEALGVSLKTLYNRLNEYEASE
ncbi:MAG: sigma-54 dependent transcriptional regulator [Woeseia sp.]|nr:sigma-54 dependent transcriptional regulator [Woeseia sp.]